MSRIIKRLLVALLLIAAGIELVLRYAFGFCNAPLYVAHPQYEYIYAPNQEVKRFGNHIRTNSLSMRSKELSSADSVVVLLIGDSVVNGGSLTDQDSLASTLLESRLSGALEQPVRVLNISAGSWGPDNGAAYLQAHGLFGARVMCLVASSHDAHDRMTHEKIVGVDPNLPDRQYRLALLELWDRYLYPLYFRDFSVSEAKYFAPVSEGGIRKDGDGFNPGFMELKEIAKREGIPFFIYLHPEISEVEAGAYNEQGHEIIRFADDHGVRLVAELEHGPRLSNYRSGDVIHYNSRGQAFLARNLYPLFLEYLKAPM